MVDPYTEFFLEQRLGANRAQRDAGAITFDEQFIARRELHLFQHGLRKNDSPGTVDGGDICEAEDHFFAGALDKLEEAIARLA